MFKDVFSLQTVDYRDVLSKLNQLIQNQLINPKLFFHVQRDPSCSLSAVTCLYFCKGLHQNLLFWPRFPGHDVINTVITAAFTDRRFLFGNIFIRSIVSVYIFYICIYKICVSFGQQ